MDQYSNRRFHAACSSCFTSPSLTQTLTLAIPCSVVAVGGRVMNAWARSTNAKYSSPLPNKKKFLTVCKDEGKSHFVKDCRDSGKQAITRAQIY